MHIIVAEYYRRPPPVRQVKGVSGWKRPVGRGGGQALRIEANPEESGLVAGNGGEGDGAGG